ncbi:hypothetical protein BIV57_05485 [Mangrovactinospora gilvigrisea]|uniref:DNA primase/polymerase bifunctional N-terminal domain-containing protein n=1 Tax=Mangrovactinospora gilvigrisea TaxID=1428644 RepID=A0A1J7BYB0_9ACTN|nr:bifunctional DNA primase/polymerase [Mangrovactinospora gilvigrisea]OIV38457.1 hypothetical protein BIV57_05485 [Mangrovactinospora gilvigrisea]
MRAMRWNRSNPGRRRRARRTVVSAAALRCAEQWNWPVLPGAGLDPQGSGACVCRRGEECPFPGEHPLDPPLLAATADPRMVRWWWTARPDAPLLVATGSRVAAVSLPRAAQRAGMMTLGRGPVVVTPSRVVWLMRPYSFEQLGELLSDFEWVPGTVRFHGEGGWVTLPPSRGGSGVVRWGRLPELDAQGMPELPDAVELMGDVVAGARRLV